MSIVSTTELWDSRSGQQNWKGQVQYSRKFRVYVSTTADHTTAILASGSIPARLQAHPTNAYALVESRKVTNDPSDPLQYLVDVSYTSVFDMDPATTNENPLSRPAIWSFSFEHGTRAVREDLDGNAITNSCELPIDPPCEIELSVPVIQIDINVASFSYASIATYQDACNSDSWQGFSPGQVKVRGITVKSVYENSQVYFQKSWVLAVKWDGWRPTRILDQGYQHLGNSGIIASEEDGKPYINRDRFGNPLPHPCLLDGEGNILDPELTGVFREFNLVREVAFTGVVGL